MIRWVKTSQSEEEIEEKNQGLSKATKEKISQFREEHERKTGDRGDKQ